MAVAGGRPRGDSERGGGIKSFGPRSPAARQQPRCPWGAEGGVKSWSNQANATICKKLPYSVCPNHRLTKGPAQYNCMYIGAPTALIRLQHDGGFQSWYVM